MISCNLNSDKAELPTKEKYTEDTTLMINICRKYAAETDIETLHKVAVATQQTRVVPCANFNGECNLYGDCLNLIINASKDGIMSPQERIEIKAKLAELERSVHEGKIKLQKSQK